MSSLADCPRPVERWALRVGLALVLIGLVSRLLRYALDFPFWGDEAALALNLVHRDFRGLTCELDHYQIAPLLYLWLEKALLAWRGASEVWLRLPALLAGCGALVLFWGLARRCLPGWPAALAAGLLAVLAYPIESASLLKPYSIDLLLGVVVLSLAVEGLRDHECVRWLAALALFAPIAVGFSYPVVFVAGAASLVLAPVAWRGGVRARGWFLAYNVLLGGAFLAHLLLVGREPHDPTVPAVKPYMETYWAEGFPPGAAWSSLVWLVQAHVRQMFAVPRAWPGAGVAGLALVAIGTVALWRRWRALAVLCVLPFALHLAAAMLRRYPYGADSRLEQHLVPSICLLWAAGVGALLEWLARGEVGRLRGYAVVAGLFAVVGLGTLHGHLRRPFKDDLSVWARDVGVRLCKRVEPGDLVLLRGQAGHPTICVRWNLAPLGDQVRHDRGAEAIDPEVRRVWLVEVRTQRVIDPQLQPSAYDEAAALSRLGSSWRTAEQTRILARQHEQRGRSLWCCCDVHLVERVGAGVVKGR